MKKTILTVVLLGIAVCFGGCGSDAPAPKESTVQQPAPATAPAPKAPVTDNGEKKVDAPKPAPEKPEPSKPEAPKKPGNEGF
ncbi:MAG: hypothetical protein H6Q73_3936 [Firmicutes bacterium]|nr:hypothetical protein [Bacillota bacterium]